MALVHLAVARDDYDTAINLVEMAVNEARKARDTEHLKHVVGRSKEVEELSKAFREVKRAADKLEEDPTDPDANLAVGRYRCLVKGDWDNGLPMLALGSDAVLKDLAVTELGVVATEEQQAELADRWWELAKKEEGRHQRLIREHAASWYQNAIAGLKGLSKSRAESRIRVATDIATESHEQMRMRPATIYAACDNSFHLYVNGKAVLSGGMSGETKDLAFRSGDVVTVKVADTGWAYGFCCVIRFKTGMAITTRANWMGYHPASPSEWFQPDTIKDLYAPISPGKKSPDPKLWPSSVVLKSSGIAAPMIWGNNKKTSYLVCRIP
jgi:hypothetical protein